MIPPTLNVPRAPFRSPDDKAFAAIWSQPAMASLTFADGTPAPANLQTEIRVFHNTRMFFVLFTAIFEDLRIAPAYVPTEPGNGKTLKLWEHSDVLECFIGPNAAAARRYKEFQVAPDGRFIDIAVDRVANPHSGDMTWNSGARFASTVDVLSKTWRAVMEIPWEAIEVDSSRTFVVECNFYRATGTFHGDELLAWSPTGYGEKCFHRVEHFGRLQIVDY